MKHIKTNQDVLITIEVTATTFIIEGIIILIDFRRESNVLESAENEFFQDFFTFQWIAKVFTVYIFQDEQSTSISRFQFARQW